MVDQKMKDCRCEVSNENVKHTQLNWNLFMRRVASAMRVGYITATLKPNNKACGGNMSVLFSESRCRHQLEGNVKL